MCDVDVNIYDVCCLSVVALQCLHACLSIHAVSISRLPSFLHDSHCFVTVVSLCAFVYFYIRVRMHTLFFFYWLPHTFFLSTPEFRSPSHGGNLNRSASLSCTERAPESASVGGSVSQIPGTPFQYIPDFSVRALTDLQFVKVMLRFTHCRLDKGGKRIPEVK